MSLIDEAFRSFLVTGLGSGWNAAGKIEQDAANENAPLPRVWYQRRGGTQDLMMNGVCTTKETVFDLAVISDNIDETQTIAESIKVLIHGYLGAFDGSNLILCAFYQDHEDDYIPEAMGEGDAGLHMAVLKINLLHRNT